MKPFLLRKMSLKRFKIFPQSAQRYFRMDSSYVLGIVAGGAFVSALGGVAEYMREKEMPSYKGLVRDFLIGAVLVVFLLQIMPESMSNVLSYLPSFKSISDAVPSVSTMSGGDAGPDLQIGPARF
jgi:hypothetical protein